MARFELASGNALIDQPVLIKVCELKPNRAVTVRAEFSDDFGQKWSSYAKFATNPNGEVDLPSAKPVVGTYIHADSMGLFWSMQLQSSNSGNTVPFPNSVTKSLKPLVVTLTAQQQDQVVAETVIIRRFLAEGVTQIDLREGKLVATLFTPMTNVAKAPVVVVMGGSGGGFGWAHQVSALLASHGCVGIALAYFDWSGQYGLPPELVEIPLETFGTALNYLKSHFQFSLEDLAVVGYSKGAELALLLATTYPKIKRVVAYAPSSVVWQGAQMQQNGVRSSWSYGGCSLPFVSFPEGYFDEAGWNDDASIAEATIPVEKIAGPLLLISGTDDGIWPSKQMANKIMMRLEQFGRDQNSSHLCFSGAGHNLSVPFLPSVAFDDAAVASNAEAERQAWQTVKEFLRVPTT